MENEILKAKSLISEENLLKVNELLNVLNNMELSEENKLEGVLYYAYKNNKIELEQIKKDYSEKVFNTIQVLEKLDKINYSQQETEAENIRKMFFAITKDIRTIMLKIAFAVVDLRYAENKTQEEKTELSNSIFSLFAPLSARLGLSAYKTELENGAFKLSNEELYNQIQEEVDNRFHKRQPIVERLTALVENCMKDLNIQGKVYGRKKHI